MQEDDAIFDFEKLDAYRRAIEFLAQSARITATMPSGYGHFVDQLRRASLSIPVNIAEGVGRTGARDRMRHYGIARGSAMECAAILDACRILGLADPASLRQGRATLYRVVCMLTRKCR